MKRIGETFSKELVSANVAGLPFTWGEDGDLQFSDSITDAQRNAVLAVYDAHDPSAKLPPITDVNGFIQEVKISLGGIVPANSLAVRYPLFFAACQSENWVDVQELVLDAKNSGAITTNQYNAIKTASTTFNIPVTL